MIFSSCITNYLNIKFGNFISYYLVILYIFQSAYEIDPTYVEAQTILTRVFLCISIVCLLLTLLCLLPLPVLRSTRSAKINMCFTFALLLASTLFVLQDLLIKRDNTGVIKLVNDNLINTCL